MRIIFFSDVHGNGGAFNAFLEQSNRHAPDLFVFCGDVFGYYYDQQYILNSFRNIPRLVCLMGNHDKMFLDMLECKIDSNELQKRYGKSCVLSLQTVSAENIDFLRTWPLCWEYSEGNIKIGAFHGSPAAPLTDRIYPDTVISDQLPFLSYTHVISCHTHHKLDKMIGKTRLLNPGSLGQPRDGKGCSYLLFDTAGPSWVWHIVTYDRALLKNRILLHDPDKPKFIEMLYREAN